VAEALHGNSERKTTLDKRFGELKIYEKKVWQAALPGLQSIPLLYGPGPQLQNQGPTLLRKFETVNFPKGSV
jgi:hypothetical protein